MKTLALGLDVVMAMSQKQKLPKISRRQSQETLRYGARHSSRSQKTDLPGIGSYVIDSPEDENMGARQKCLRYQESHRGIAKPRTESLTDIPKRCHLKPIPVATIKDASPSPQDLDRGTPSRVKPHSGSRTPEDLIAAANQRSRREGHALQQFLARESGGKIPLPQEELVSRSPIGRLSSCSPGMYPANVPIITGFGLRKAKAREKDCRRDPPKAYTNLSVNVELAVPSQVTCRATERELDSQADYRRQLTVYLTPCIGADGHTTQENTDANGVVHIRESSVGDRELAVRCDIPRDKIGPSTRNQIWASNLRLGELLKHQVALPELKRHGMGVGTPSFSKASKSLTADVFKSKRFPARNSEKNLWRKSLGHVGSSRKDFIYGSPANRFRNLKKRDEEESESDSDGSEDEEEAWLNMVDTPLIEHAGYDRYANVKLPRSRFQSTGLART